MISLASLVRACHGGLAYVLWLLLHLGEDLRLLLDEADVLCVEVVEEILLEEEDLVHVALLAAEDLLDDNAHILIRSPERINREELNARLELRLQHRPLDEVGLRGRDLEFDYGWVRGVVMPAIETKALEEFRTVLHLTEVD